LKVIELGPVNDTAGAARVRVTGMVRGVYPDP
jgi:hypothetical protein